VAFRSSVGIITSLGTAPRATFGLTAQAGVRRGPVSLAIEARDDLPVSASTHGASGVTTALLQAALVPCLHHLFVSGCALASAGAMRGWGFGVDRPLSQTTPWAAAGGRIAIELEVATQVLVRVHLDVLATLTPTTLLLNGAPAWVSPPVSGALGVALAGNFL
jgi:hypothetical protein